MYLRNWVKKAARTLISSCVLSFAIVQAKLEIKSTNSQFCILNTSLYNICFIVVAVTINIYKNKLDSTNDNIKNDKKTIKFKKI